MTTTTISWTDATWNVTRGCRRVSPGCEHCYAERQANRFKGPGKAYEGLIKLVGGKPRWSGETKFAVEHLADPLRWKKPRRIFVDSMSDLFYEGFTNEQIAAVFGVMAACPQHTFQVLTKRARRMREWFEWLYNCCSNEDGYRPGDVLHHFGRNATKSMPLDGKWRDPLGDGRVRTGPWPLPNVWLGVSVEDQERADERIPELLQTQAAVRFLSCEPLLGPVTIRRWLRPMHRRMGDFGVEVVAIDGIDWVIVGCESGPGARECKVEWLRSLRDQCAAAGVPYFLKQATYAVDHPDATIGAVTYGDGSSDKQGGGVVELPYLDGVQHAAFPEAS